MQVRSLTVLQNWDCHSCGECCRSYRVPVTDAERARIEAQGWANDPELKGQTLFERRKGETYLAHKPDGACVFLGPDKLCRIHAAHGSLAKPLACRVYPILLVPAGDHWNLGLRFECPSAASNKGTSLTSHLGTAREFAAALEAGPAKGAEGAAPPPLQGKQFLPWSDLARIATAVSKLLADLTDPFERRWRRVLFLVSTLRKAKFDGGGDQKKTVTGGRLSEMLHVLSEASEDEVPDEATELKPPGWTGRTVFRQLAAVYARKDHGTERGPALGNPFARLWSAVRFASGRGRVPRVHAALSDAVRFADTERPLPELSEASEDLLERWHRVKVESLQFCGPTNFGLPVWAGLESLALTFPIAMWLARLFAAGGMSPDAAVARGARIADDNFGFNPLLGSARQKFALRMLSTRGELPRLVAWYGRTTAAAE